MVGILFVDVIIWLCSATDFFLTLAEFVRALAWSSSIPKQGCALREKLSFRTVPALDLTIARIFCAHLVKSAHEVPWWALGQKNSMIAEKVQNMRPTPINQHGKEEPTRKRTVSVLPTYAVSVFILVARNAKCAPLKVRQFCISWALFVVSCPTISVGLYSLWAL